MIFRNSRPEVFCPEACNFIKKETLAQVFSCEFCEFSKSTFSSRITLVVASWISVTIDLSPVFPVSLKFWSVSCRYRYLFLQIPNDKETFWLLTQNSLIFKLVFQQNMQSLGYSWSNLEIIWKRSLYTRRFHRFIENLWHSWPHNINQETRNVWYQGH